MRDSEKTEPGILRAQAAALRDRVGHRIPDILEACADELSRLTARVAELEGALSLIAELESSARPDCMGTIAAIDAMCRATSMRDHARMQVIARAALQAAAQVGVDEQ